METSHTRRLLYQADSEPWKERGRKLPLTITLSSRPHLTLAVLAGALESAPKVDGKMALLNRLWLPSLSVHTGQGDRTPAIGRTSRTPDPGHARSLSEFQPSCP